MEVSCFNCNTKTNLEVGFEVKNFVCPKCHSLYEADKNGEPRLQRKFNYTTDFIGLEIGQKGILEKVEYTVVGILTKKVYEKFYWNEYVLVDNSNNFVYLSESDGHWIFLTEINEKYEVSRHPSTLVNNEIEMNLYQYTDAEIVSAQGYFDFDIPKGKIHMVEYIQPPFMISIEKMNSVESTFFGKHISKNQIKKAFPTAELPIQTGNGIVQPFLINLRGTAIVFCIVAIMILCSHFLIYENQSSKEILNVDLFFDEYNNKDFVSPSFILEGGSAPMTVSLQSSVDNSWANVNIILVNEKTNDEIYANKDIEYYHGYEDGENWTEGSNSEKFNICGVSEGKYHLRISPQKAPEDKSSSDTNVKVIWNEATLHNFWMIVLFMGILLIVIFYIERNFEKKRWADSDNSPYEEE